VAGDNLFIGSCTGKFCAYNKTTGKIHWLYDTSLDGGSPQFHGDPMFTEKLVIIGSDSTEKGYVYAFEKDTGKLNWKTAAGGLGTNLCRFQNSIIGGTNDGQLVALDINSGEILWKFSTKTITHYRSSSTPALVGGTVYFGGPDGSVYALKAKNGEFLWNHALGSRITTPVRAKDNYLYVGVRDRAVYCLHQRDGQVLAKINTPDFPHHSLVVVEDSILVLLGESRMACLDINHKRIRWSRSVLGEWTTYKPLVFDELVLVGDNEGRLFLLRQEDGSTVNSFQIGGVLRGLGKRDSILYIGTLKGMVHALKYDAQ
jgi:outer membrane protein assembly factor BamB